MNQPEPTVKQVMSGDSIIIRGKPSGKPPPETTLNFSNISAPKLAKRPPGNTGEESKDEPWAWEAREFLRKRLIGKRIGSDLTYVTEKVNEREYHVVYFGKDTSGECLNKLLVKEGLVSLRPSAPAAYKELEEQAKTAGKGKFSKTQPLVREVRWVPTPASMQQLVDHFERKPIKTVIENVRDGSTVRCFVTMEDKTYHVTLLIAGIRCPGFRPEGEGDPPPFAHEAKYFVEIRLLQMDVEITLDAVQNNNIIGNIYHPKGNIAERLVEEGYAKCFDHTIQYTKNIEELRKLEKQAKNKGLRLWKNWQSSSPPIADADKGFTGTVIEIINGDGMKVKLANGTTKKIFLSSIRPPRMPEGENKDGTAPSKKSIRPLYDIPWMFEAREFLRKKLIRKKVNVTVDYIQPARDDLPAKTCCTVMVGQTNVAEALVSKGLATVIKNRQDDDQRSSQWDKLNAAQNKAMKSLNGLHGKKEEFPVHRVNDHSIDSTRAKAILPHIRRGNARIEGLVEYVASGSRLRLFLPKDSCLITLLLAGITCPRAPRQTPGGNDQFKDEDPFGQEALDFTREKVLQREVEFSIESLDKAGNFIGWLWYDNVNLSVALVQEGLCKIHQFSAGKSLQNYNALMDAEKHAKDNRINIWKDYKEEEEIVQPQEEEVERKVNHQKVVVIEVTDNLHIYVQLDEQTAKLEAMLEKMRKELQFALTGAYTPKKGDLCAAKFRGDNQWYRAKVEKVSGGKAKVFYVDYGNRDEVDTKDCATLPSGFDVDKPYAHEYALAYVKLVNDIDYQEQTLDALREDLLNGVFLLNVEYKTNGIPHVTLVDPTTDADMVKSLVEQGYLLIDKRREKRLHQVVQDYIAAEEKARKAHKVIWEHGDITEDDDREFGMGRKER